MSSPPFSGVMKPNPFGVVEPLYRTSCHDVRFLADFETATLPELILNNALGNRKESATLNIFAELPALVCQGV